VTLSYNRIFNVMTKMKDGKDHGTCPWSFQPAIPTGETSLLGVQ